MTCEPKTGEVYRGHLLKCEDNMDVMMMLEDVTVTGRDGEVTNVDQVHLSWPPSWWTGWVEAG